MDHWLLESLGTVRSSQLLQIFYREPLSFMCLWKKELTSSSFNKGPTEVYFGFHFLIGFRCGFRCSAVSSSLKETEFWVLSRTDLVASANWRNWNLCPSWAVEDKSMGLENLARKHLQDPCRQLVCLRDIAKNPFLLLVLMR